VLGKVVATMLRNSASVSSRLCFNEKSLDGRYHAHGFFFGELNAEIFQPILHRVNSASLPHNHFHARLAYNVPVEGKELRGVSRRRSFDTNWR